jgi:hypothetical protein
VNRTIILSIIAFMTLVFAIPAFSGTKEGQNELRADGSLTLISADQYDQSTLSGQIVYNRFIKDNVSIGAAIRPQISTEKYGDGDTEKSAQLFFLGRGDYYLATDGSSPWVPYLGLHAGFINYTYESGGESDSKTVLTYGLQGGGKYFLTENTSMNVELDFSRYTRESDAGSKDVDVITLLFGYSYYF